MFSGPFGRFKNYLTGESLSDDKAGPELLPHSVRMRLQHEGAQLDAGHIEHLMQARLQRLAFYLLMKAGENDNAQQMGLLHRMGKLDYDFSQLTLDHVRPSIENLKGQDPPTVHGGKLAQVSRHGFNEWAQLFDRTIGNKLEQNPDSTLFMLANAPYIGFDALALHSLKQGKPLGILRPEKFMSQPSKETGIGYLLHPAPWGGVSIAELTPDFERPEGVIIFDDVIKSGGVREQTRGFWTQNGTNESPDFFSAIKANGHI